MNRPPMETEGSEASIGDFESPRSHVMPPGYYGDGTQNIEDPSVSYLSPIIHLNLQMVKELFSLTLHIINWLFCIKWTLILQAFRSHSSPAPRTGAGKIRVVHSLSTVSVLSPDYWSCCCRLFSCNLKGRWIFLCTLKGGQIILKYPVGSCIIFNTLKLFGLSYGILHYNYWIILIYPVVSWILIRALKRGWIILGVSIRRMDVVLCLLFI